MVSGDSVRVEIGGKEYAVISGRLEAIGRENGEMRSELREIHTEIRQLSEELHMLAVEVRGINARIEDMKFYVSLSFGALAVFVGLMAFVPVVGKILHGLTKPAMNEERMSRMIDDAVARAMSARG